MNTGRRSFLAASAALVVAGSSGCSGKASDERQLQFASLGAAEEELARLAQAGTLASSASWNWAQTLNHCAQSIEYSMTGFPAAKSMFFQRTVGAAAFGVFAWRGRMTHDLAEPIPGAPVLDGAAEATQALERLRAAILHFHRWTGPMRAHFAYGELDKKDYELAHAMHLANHLSAFQARRQGVASLRSK
ncbi:MAG: DUF1569 domain-containing protein [Pseudomonadota bacterium]